MNEKTRSLINRLRVLKAKDRSDRIKWQFDRREQQSAPDARG